MTADDCRAGRGDLAALALGRLDPDAAGRVRAHADGCAACRAELAALRGVAAALPAADLAHLDADPAPPLDLGDRIVAAIDREAMRRPRGRRLRVAVAAIAAAVVLAVGVAAVATRDSGDRTPTMQAFAVAAPGVDARYSLQANGAGTVVRFAQSGLDPQQRYWLWLTDASGRRVSAGSFTGTPTGGPLVLQTALPLADAKRIWLTDAADAVVLDALL